MFDHEFENDFEASDEAAAAAPANEVLETIEVVAEAPEVMDAPVEDDFFAENEAAAVPAVDPAHVITINPSSSASKYVVSEDGSPFSVLELLSRAELRMDGDFQCFLNGAQIEVTTLVPAGETVSIVGKVKGGADQ